MKMLQVQEDHSDEDVSLFGFWNVCLFLSNIFNLFANLLIFFNEFTQNLKLESVEHIIALLLACGCFLCWINILYILSLFENFNVVNKTLANSAPEIFWFSLGIAPIFSAFVFTGFCMFHECDRFETVGTSYLGLLCLFAADEYQDFYLDTEDYPFSGFFFSLYGVVILIIIANVFVFIIEAGYEKECRDQEARAEKKEELQKKLDQKQKMRKLLLEGIGNKMQEKMLRKCLGDSTGDDQKEREKIKAILDENIDDLKDEMKQAMLNNMDDDIEQMLQKIELINELFNEIENALRDLMDEALGKEEF
jgi:hypothetical protein